MPLVLIADDASGVRRSLQRILEDYPYPVLTAESTSEVASLLEQEVDDLALAVVDIVFPETGGISTMKMLKERFPQAAIIAVTGGADLGDERRWLEENSFAILIKPFDNDSLRRLVDRALQRS